MAKIKKAGGLELKMDLLGARSITQAEKSPGLQSNGRRNPTPQNCPITGIMRH